MQGKMDDFDLYVIDADGSNLQPLTTGENNDLLPAWSPDGEWIAFHRDCNLWIMRSDGTQVEPLSFMLCVASISWSPDSQWMAFIDNSGGPENNNPMTVRVFQHGGDESRIIYTFDRSVDIGRLAWSPDGKQIFCEYFNNDHQAANILIDVNGKGVVEENGEIPVSWFQDFWPRGCRRSRNRR